LSPPWRALCTAQLSRCDSVSRYVGAVRGGTTGVTKTSWCRSAPQFPAGGRAEEARAGKRWSVGRCEADRPNAGSRLEEPRSAHSLGDRGMGQIPSPPRGVSSSCPAVSRWISAGSGRRGSGHRPPRQPSTTPVATRCGRSPVRFEGAGS
jgi:hypothetical protein